eukprot:gene6223-7752_t
MSTTTTSSSSLNKAQTQQQQQQQQHFDVSQWEKKSKLSTEQILSVNNLNKCIQRDKPLPPKNLSQFYHWFSIIEKTNTHLHQYEWFLENIITYADGSDKLLSLVESCGGLVDSIQTDYSNLTKKTNQLHESCERFFKEELRLRYIVQSIHDKLKYFNELENSTKKLNAPNFKVTDPQFMTSLESLENCLNFMKQNSKFAESNKYALQYGFLFSRALGLIKDFIAVSLKLLSKEILQTQKYDQLQQIQQQQQQLQQQDPNNSSTTTVTTLPTSNTPSSSLDSFQNSNIKFRAFSPKLRPLCQELEKRAVGQYSSFLDDTQMIYINCRKLILTPILYQWFQNLIKDQNGVQSMVRNAAVYMLQFYENEYQVYGHFFEKPSIHLNELLDEYSQQLYDVIRPVYIHIHSFQILCDLAHVIRHELLEEITQQSLKYCQGFQLTVNRMLQDIQERLIYVIQTYIRDEIRSFIPKPEDLDYPKKLIPSSPNSSTTPITSSPNLSSSTKNIYATWYPTLEKSLTCLSKMYLVLENKIFEGLAQEVVEACTFTLIQASKLLSQKLEANIIIDSQLFLIKHLLTLREQITPFDINFIIIEKIVDFPNLKHALSTLYNFGSLLTLSNNPIYSLLSPRITNTSIDSKKDLEKELKQTIESFILSTANNTIDPLLSQLTKISVFLNQCTRTQTDPMTLYQQPFADPLRIKETIALVKNNIQTYLPDIISKMGLYLSPSTQNLLMKPIRTNIIDSFNQIGQYAKKYYNEEQIKSMELISPDSLKLILDSIAPLNPTTTKQQPQQSQSQSSTPNQNASNI